MANIAKILRYGEHVALFNNLKHILTKQMRIEDSNHMGTHVEVVCSPLNTKPDEPHMRLHIWQLAYDRITLSQPL